LNLIEGFETTSKVPKIKGAGFFIGVVFPINFSKIVNDNNKGNL